MAVISIRNHEVDVDIREELSEYDFGYNAKERGDKLIAASPFRSDNQPSFFVNLDGEYAGVWGDSGAIDDDYTSGGFVQLLAHLRGEGYEEACDYLLGKYGALHEIIEGESIRIRKPRLHDDVSHGKHSVDPLVVTLATSPYLLRREIGEQTQARYGIGYNANHVGFTAIPWYDETGAMANVKYRSTRNKRFFYETGGERVSDLVYGIHTLSQTIKGIDRAVVVEGEIDALSFAEVGAPAIALGGAHVSRRQVEIIERSGIRELVLGGDNDEQGRRLNRQLTDALRGSMRLYSVDYGQNKDANAVLTRHGAYELRSIYDDATPVRTIRIRDLAE